MSGNGHFTFQDHLESKSKAAFPLTCLGARRVALRRPRGKIKNRSDTIAM